MTEISGNFARNLKHLRIKKGLNQAELGNILGKDYSTIGKWENGTRSPNVQDTIDVCNFFDITLNDMLLHDLVLKNEYKLSPSEFETEVKNLLSQTSLDPKKKDTMISILEMVCEGGDGK